jgi:hypothetical protein
MTTTTKLGDFLGRGLVNATPGTSDATDHIGRNVTAGNKDWMGRLLLDNPLYPPALWVAATSYAVGARARLAGGAILQATVGGTSHATTAPTAPAVNATVVDNTVTWQRLV